MTHKISQDIIGYEVVKQDQEPAAKPIAAAEEKSNIIQMHESLQRPEMLLGSTYKIKTPLSEHSLYITINDIVLNHDTDHEQRRPFEVFINSKNMDHFQWIVALTRIISAVFRKGGDVTFLVEELHS
ncbi:MAG: NrdJb, partial [Cycloclasticus sp.]|nr:NrdJb [Cycloclasticus sp.]